MAVCFNYFFERCNFLNKNISQGSVVTYLRCGGIFKYEFVANLSVSLSVKNVQNRLTFWEVMGKSLVSCFFDSQCMYMYDVSCNV